MERPHPSTGRAMRNAVELLMRRLEAEAAAHDARQRRRGDRSRHFLRDPERFALAFAECARLQDEELSRHASHAFAAAVLAPRTARVKTTHVETDDAVTIRLTSGERGADPVRERARTLGRKRAGLPPAAMEWVQASGVLLATADLLIRTKRVETSRYKHTLACLERLGWRDVPPDMLASYGNFLNAR